MVRLALPLTSMSDAASTVPVATMATSLPYADPRTTAPPVSPEAADVGSGSLRARAIRGTLWTTGGYGAQQVLRLATNLVLTRLLSPPMFGLMSLVNVFIQGLQGFSDVGIGPSIVQSKRGDDPAFLNTAWTIQVFRGMTLGAVSALIAWPVSKLYGERQLMWLLPAAGMSAVIAGFNCTALYTLSRHLEVGKLTLRNLVGQIAGAAVMISWAMAQRSVWALLAGNIAAALATLAFSYTLIPGQRNYFHWDRTAARELTSFGRWIFVSTILTFLAMEADRFIFGKMITMAELGVYGVAAMMSELPVSAMLKLGGAVVFPAFSRSRPGRGDFQQVFDRVRLPLLAGCGLVTAGLVAGGQYAIEFLYDPRYHRAGWMLQLMAFSGWFQVMQVTNGSALLAMGSPRSIAAGNVVKLITMIVGIPIGYYWTRHWGTYSLLGPILAIVVSEVLKYLVLAVAARRKGLRMMTTNWGLTALLLASAGVAWVAGNWARHVDARPAVAKLWAMFVVGVVCSGVWGPVVYRSLRSRKAVA
jgi:O-antigen/teichoic acid export membrane protein